MHFFYPRCAHNPPDPRLHSPDAIGRGDTTSAETNEYLHTTKGMGVCSGTCEPSIFTHCTVATQLKTAYHGHKACHGAMKLKLSAINSKSDYSWVIRIIEPNNFKHVPPSL